MGRADLRIDWATHAAAKYAVENWHYSRSMPSASVKIGAWENGVFIGVVIFGRGAASEIGSPYGLPQDHICELVRVALREHKSPTSKILALALRFLRNANPGLRMVVSFADTAQGHHGGIYQAGGWVFEGTKEYHAYRVGGKVVHPKTLHSKYGVGGQSVGWLRQHVDPNAERIKGEGKHKYLMPLDDAMRAQIAPLAKPYPKRAKDQDAANPAALGGETPTRTLQGDNHAASSA
jgi:hypothetical protein